MSDKQCPSCGGFCGKHCQRESLNADFAYRETGHEKLRLEIDDIDSRFTQRLALLLECMLIDSHGHWNDAASLLDEYKAAWEAVNPSPPTFMGEPMPPERREILRKLQAKREQST